MQGLAAATEAARGRCVWWKVQWEVSWEVRWEVWCKFWREVQWEQGTVAYLFDKSFWHALASINPAQGTSYIRARIENIMGECLSPFPEQYYIFQNKWTMVLFYIHATEGGLGDKRPPFL
jgi:hypothetical protein